MKDPDTRKAPIVTVTFDPEFKSQAITLNINRIPLTEALDAIAAASNTEWRAVGPATIFVYPKR